MNSTITITFVNSNSLAIHISETDGKTYTTDGGIRYYPRWVLVRTFDGRALGSFGTESEAREAMAMWKPESKR